MDNHPINSNPERKPINGKLVDSILQTLRKEYVVVGKTSIKAWHAWLVLGLVAGTAAGIFLVTNRSGEVEKGMAATTSGITVELDLPSYYPDFLRHPQKFFSGQPIRIIASGLPDQDAVLLAEAGTGQTRSLSVKRKLNPQTFSLDLPADVSSGRHTFSFTAGGQTQQFQLEVHGLTEVDNVPASVINPLDLLQRLAIKYRTEICKGCYWEMVFAGDPVNPKELVHANGGLLSRSQDAGRTWKTSTIDGLVVNPLPGIFYSGDPKAISLPNGLFLLSSLGGAVYHAGYSSNLTMSICQDLSGKVSFFDFPKLAVDNSPSSPRNSYVYISGGTISGIELCISADGGNTFTREQLAYSGPLVTSMAISDEGTLWATFPNQPNDQLLKIVSLNPISFTILTLPGHMSGYGPRISQNSSQVWHVYRGPEILADTSPSSPHRGRLYAIWSQEEKVIPDPNFQYPYYGYNFDVFVSYSDDKGQTWSSPAKVNDDDGAGDQFFPSARVDSNGVLHVAFVDHRNNQNLPVFDIYYAKSEDGVKFSRNLRINAEPVANNPAGGRTIGDYLDMVAAYPGRVYVAYPCGQSQSGPTGACMAQVDPRLVR